MITKAINKFSLLLVDAQGRVMVSLLKERVKVWEHGFDASQERYDTVNSEQAKKLPLGKCDKGQFNAKCEIEPTGVFIAQEPAELFCKAMIAGDEKDPRPFAHGIALIGGENMLVCSNSYVLFKANVAHTSAETVIIPIKLLKALIKVAGKKDRISVFVENGIVTLQSNGFSAQARAIAGNYPPFKMAFPQNVTSEDVLIENDETAVKEKRVKSARGTLYSVDYVKKIKDMGFSNQFCIESVHRPALFRLGDPWQCEALIVPCRA